MHGFRDVVFLGDHGSYQNELRVVADRLNREWRASGVRAHAVVEYYRAAESPGRPRSASAATATTRSARMPGSPTRRSRLPSIRASCVPTSFGPDAKPAASEGIFGDPRRASADLGRVGVDLIVAATVAAIRKSTARP